MATIQETAPSPWRIQFCGMPASFCGIRYHVEQQARSSGRRIVMHEYPKKDIGYAEDMGRSAIRYQVTGYLIGPNYNTIKQQLIKVLESTEGGPLIDPYLATPMKAVCERYSVTETREKGGYCTFEMNFAEAGKAGFSDTETNTSSALQSNASAAGESAESQANAAAQGAQLNADAQGEIIMSDPYATP